MSERPIEEEETRQEKFMEDFLKENQETTMNTSQIDGVYKMDNLTIKVGKSILPSNESVIVIFRNTLDDFLKERNGSVILKSLSLEHNPIFSEQTKPIHKINEFEVYKLQEDKLLLAHPNNSGKLYDMIISPPVFKVLKRISLNSINSIYYPIHSSRLKTSPNFFDYVIKHLENDSFFFKEPFSFTFSYEDNLQTIPNLSQWEKISSPTIKNKKANPKNKETSLGRDKIDFHLDDPALEDKLGRRPIAQSLAKLINDDIFGNEKCHAFMAHLQGRWGEGKSSFMKFLEDGLQEAEENRWVIIHYNAWKNQNVDPPWWTFLDAIYRQGREKIRKKSRLKVILRELARRMNSGTLLSISITAFILFLILSGSNLLGISFLDLPETAKIVVSLSTITASLFAIGQGWSKFFVVDTPENARLFMRKADNPTGYIKTHFKELIEDLQTKHSPKEQNYRIAVFIDDLDRCEGIFVVSLLEGIQTMFNEQKVFYLVAADKHWIAKSFENVYSDYSDTVKKGTKLGYSFIEKNFQLSVRLPNPSKEQIRRYWDFILNSKGEVKEEATSENIEAFKSELNQTNQSEILSGKADIDELSKKHNVSIEEAQSAVLEKVNESTKDIEHLLRDHHELIGNNPRAVKRLANQYTVYRNLVLIEQSKVDPLKLFRWVILQNRWPILVDKIESIPSSIESIDGDFLKEINLESNETAINFVIGEGENRLTEDDVVKFTGISNVVSNEANEG